MLENLSNYMNTYMTMPFNPGTDLLQIVMNQEGLEEFQDGIHRFVPRIFKHNLLSGVINNNRYSLVKVELTAF